MADGFYDPSKSYKESDRFEVPYFEHVILPLAARAGAIAKDVRKVKKYQNIDVDFVLERGEDLRYYESKFDHEAANSGYLFFETVSSISGNTPGCMLKSAADRMQFVVPLLGKVYSFNLKRFSRYWFFHEAGTPCADPLSVRPDAYPPEGPRGWDPCGKKVPNKNHVSWGYRCTPEALAHPTHAENYDWREAELPEAYLRDVVPAAAAYLVQRSKNPLTPERVRDITAPEVVQWLD